MSVTFAATIERQLSSRFRSGAYWISAVLPVVLIGLLLFQAGRATGNPAMTMFLAVLSALWIGGSGSVREIVDERRLVQREPHLSLLAYGVAKILHASLMAAGQSLILTVAVLWSGVVVVPLPGLWLLVLLTTLAGSLMALLLSALCDEAASALAWFPLMLVPQVVFGGFLFPYAPIHAFAWNPATEKVQMLPAEFARMPVDSASIKALGTLAVSRWALEAYAAQTYEQDLGDPDALKEAIAVNDFVPLTLTSTPVASRLLERAEAIALHRPPPSERIDAARSLYLGVLSGFVLLEIALLVLILPVRDPRRA